MKVNIDAEKTWTSLDYLRTLPAIILGIFIVYYSSLSFPIPPGTPKPPEPFDINIILHVAEFATFSFLMAFGFLNKFKAKYLLAFIIIFGVLDEVHQYFVPYRYFDVMDIVCDGIGAILGLLTYIGLRNFRNKN